MAAGELVTIPLHGDAPRAVSPDACPSCGAGLGGRAGCQAVFDALCAAAWSSPTRGAVHNVAVDAYCLQHPEEYCHSTKSFAAHLVGLCCGVETAGGARLYWTIARWLDGPQALGRPVEPGPGVRGAVTIAKLAGPMDDAAFAAGVREWAAAVWAAYDSQHVLAREWLTAAAAAARERVEFVGR